MKKKNIVIGVVCIGVALISLLFGAFTKDEDNGNFSKSTTSEYVSYEQNTQTTIDLNNVPEFSGAPWCEINNNIPALDEINGDEKYFEAYAPLDNLGRCGVAYACLGKETMPTEERGEIGQVKPSGWITAKYDCVDGKYLYNRCHLIGFQLSGENANERNLITGTRYMNVQGMLPFENMVADYIKETGNHVLYRITPVFEGFNLVAKGVQMEAYSVEDDGEGICFNIFCYNNQPGVVIDYATGKSRLDDSEPSKNEVVEENYILNLKSRKFHRDTCSSVNSINEDNKKEYTGPRDNLINDGYSPCGSCKP